MFPESNLQVTNHVLLSDRKLQENIEEQHVMRMEVTVQQKLLFSSKGFNRVVTMHIHVSFNTNSFSTSSPAAFSIPFGDSSIQASFRIQHVHIVRIHQY